MWLGAIGNNPIGRESVSDQPGDRLVTASGVYVYDRKKVYDHFKTGLSAACRMLGN